MANYNMAELKGAVRILESIIEVADEEGDEVVPVTDIRILLNKYRARLKAYEKFSS